MTALEGFSTLAIVGPLLASLIALSARPALIRTALATGSASTLVAAIGLWETVTRDGPGRHLLGGWGQPLGIELRADGFSVAMIAVTAVVGAATSLYSTAYFEDHSERPLQDSPAGRGARYFAPLWLLMWTSLNGLYLSADLFNLYVNLEILGFSAAAVVTLAISRQAMVAGMRYLVISLTGSMLFLFGVGLLYVEFGTLSLEGLAAIRPTGPLPAVALGVMTAGLAAKTALFPFHAWLPPAHAVAPAPGSAILSALVVKGSFVVLVRLWFGVYGESASAALVLMGVLGAIAILWGSILALRQMSLKRLVAYSTVAQLGYLFVMFPLLVPGRGVAWSTDAWTGGLLLAVSHALAKSAMFLAAGNMSYAVASDRIPLISGIGRRLPMSFLAFGLGGLSLAGLPPTAGFLGKWLLVRSSLDSGRWIWAVVIALGGLLTIAYVLRVLQHALDPTATPEGYRPVPRRMEWAALVLALGSVGLGIRSVELVELLLQSGAFPW